MHNPLGALRHATLADDPTLMRDMLNQHGTVLATSGQHEEVSEVLGVLDTAGLLRGDVELMLLGVLAHMELGRADAADALLTPRARDALRHALAVAEQFGVLRPLVNGPADVIDLPSHELGKLGGVDELGQEVLTTRRTLDQHRPAGSEAPALTVRESAVLDLLPGPLSLDEIAARLAVTTNTVKTHLTAIYAKLGVRSRREAVARGRILVRSTR